jgi:predicted ATPase
VYGDLPTGTVTFLFTDVEGSTRLLHALGAKAYADALAEHRRVIREACAAHGGVEVDTQGDAFFFAFPGAPGALAAASAFTDALASGPIQVRVGLHTGTPLVTEEGYVGGDVHFAARVAATSHGGQVVLSQATATLVEAPLTELGEHRLKDIAEPVPIYQLGEGSFPPLKTISNTNLPRPASSFLGREAELQEVVSRIEAGARLLTLTGPGGTGKTRLSIEAASTLVPSYKAGVFWVGLASLRDPALVLETIAQTLGAKDGLPEHIQERELLLLLDNLEQVVEAAPELASLMNVCPNLTLLVTSRELLRISGEVEYAVPPLASSDAVELFCERSGLEPSAEISELCSRLDSLPLAVELAASRTRALTVSQILERLSGRLDLLKGGRDADPRQQTLRATIEWSYELLSEDEQQLFARLSVFAGGCTLEAAEEVAEADLDTLQSLVEKSLLRFTNGRYWMLETIREYAAECLDRRGGTDEVEGLHAAWMLSLLGEDTPTMAEEWIAILRPETANVRVALDRALRGRCVEPFVERAKLLYRVWIAVGGVVEGQRWLADAAECLGDGETALRGRAIAWRSDLLRVMGRLDEAGELAEEARRVFDAIGEEARGVGALETIGLIAVARGDLERAEEALAEARRWHRRHDSPSAGRLTANLADVALARHDFQRAAELAAEAMDEARRQRSAVGIGQTLTTLGIALAGLGRPDEGRRRLAEALVMFDRVGYPAGTALALEAIGAIEAAMRPERAAVLVAAAGKLREENDLALDPFERELHDSTTERLAAALAADALHRASQRGAVMSRQQVLTYVCEGGSPSEVAT